VRRRVVLELCVVAALFVIAGFIWLHPASVELLRGNRAVMIGDDSDSVTNVWQYRLVIDAFRHDPWRFLFGAIYTDQVAAPEGMAVFIPWSERLIVLALSLLVSDELLPTAVVWSYIVASGVAMHACGRLLGWPRLVAFALALAWAVCPHTRARAEVHIALVGVYFAPLAVIGVRLLAGSPRKLGWSARTDLGVATLVFLFAAAAAHYYAILLVAFSPLFLLLYALFLPRGAARTRAAGRLVVASLPAILLLVGTRVVSVPAADARRMAPAAAPAAALKAQNDLSLRVWGARAIDYAAGDVRFGERDLLPWRRPITREIREQLSENRHERTNGIRWIVLGASASLAVVMTSGRLRRRLRPEDRRLAGFAFVLGALAFVTSFAPQGIRHYDTDLGPVALVARVVPMFRVPNRVGVLVHFAALLAAGVAFSTLATRLARTRAALAPGAALLVVVVLEYLPLHPVLVAPVPPVRASLVPAAGECGGGILLPYATYDWEVQTYYGAMAELRGTSCKLIHAGYMTTEDGALLRSLSKRTFTDADLERSLAFARCTNASWALFGKGTPEGYKASFCDAMGWKSVSPDACRGDATAIGPPRTIRGCTP